MDARVAQFHSDATEIRKAGAKPKAAKEIKKLQKFLHNNQDYRFTERAKSHLFSAIEEHAALFGFEDPEPPPSMELVEDALKMPFTVFSTAQKNKMLKWYSQFGGNAGAGPAGAGGVGGPFEVQAIDIDVSSGTLTLMESDGVETAEVVLPGALAHARDEIRRALEEDRDVMVRVRGSLTDPSTCEILEYAIM